MSLVSRLTRHVLFGGAKRLDRSAPHDTPSSSVVALSVWKEAEMDDHELTKLRRLISQHEKVVFEAVKARMVAELPQESQLYAQAVQEQFD